jgi:4-amino-4-deoxy-L-arabinose transferase-like glycosyltransferase
VRRGGALLAAAWAAPALAGLAFRPLLPIDETRYLAVAWEMWHGSWLVPHLNGHPYSDKPPLLFWLVTTGWKVVGVQEWWARAVPLLCALASLLLVRRLARRLWPARPAVAAFAPAIVLGTMLWAIFQQLVLFDTLLTACVLLGVTGAVEAWRSHRRGAWALVALGVGLGVLAKGPVTLLHLLPLLLLAPWWMGTERPAGWRGWYAGTALAVLGGAALALAWAIPAAVAGGPEYARMIFLRQTTERMVSSFAHRRPPWWYVPQLPLLLFPWALWPPLWRATRRLRGTLDDAGVRFCLAWCVPVFVGFSLISGKQVHYLLPVVPAFALLAARLLDDLDVQYRPSTLPALGLLLGSIVLLAAPHVPVAMRAATWLAAVPAWPGVVLMGTGLAFAIVLARSTLPRAVLALAVMPAVALVVLAAGVLPAAVPAYDMRPTADTLRALERDGVTIAHAGPYAGQYHFTGRLEHALVVLPPEEIDAWLDAAPKRAAVVYRRRSDTTTVAHPVLFEHPYRDRMVRVLLTLGDRGS